MHTSALAGIAQRCHGEVRELASEYVEQVRVLPGYARTTVTDDELYRTAFDSLDMLMRLLAGDDVHERLRSQSEAIGRRRARQGLALDSLLRAVRMDFRFLWAALRAEAEPDELPALTDEVATIWDAVELHTSAIQSAYIDELIHLNRELEVERTSLLRQLLVEGVDDPAQLEHIALSFDLRPTGRYRVVAANPAFAEDLKRSLGAVARGVGIHAIDGMEFAIIDENTLTRESRELLLRVPAGISPVVTGISLLAPAWHVARRLSSLVTSSGSGATLLSHWPYLLEDGLGPAGALFRAEHLAALDALPAPKRQAILDAVNEYLRCGSVAESAARLYVHRNTMLKRLSRFTALTGLDVTIPAQAGAVQLLLAR